MAAGAPRPVEPSCENAICLWCEVAFFSLVGASIYLRRKQLGFEPSQSPERAAARDETERLKERARMVDDVFQHVRIGKHVDATAPLANWLRDLDAEHAVEGRLLRRRTVTEMGQPGRAQSPSAAR